MKRRWISILLIAFFVITQPLFVFGETDQEIDCIYNETGDFLKSHEELCVGSVGGEWSVIGLARAGLDLSPKQEEKYLASVEDYVKENMDDNQRLDPNRSTEHSRIILALTALGEDPTNVVGNDILYALSDFDYVRRQGINGPIWTLIALDSGNYEIPENENAENKTTRENLIRYILDRTCTEGGWAFFGDMADPDMTAMAIQSLAPYYRKNAEVKVAVDEALDVLSKLQEASGAYYSYGSTNVESTSQVLVALSQLGIDATKDNRFIKDGNTLLDGIKQFAIEGGGFRHILSGERDGMATEQGYYALVSYYRLLEGKNALYDMTDVQNPSQIPFYLIVFPAVAILLIVVIIKKTFKQNKKTK